MVFFHFHFTLYICVTLGCRAYGINVCGEGGEYETLTLDCPLFIVSLYHRWCGNWELFLGLSFFLFSLYLGWSTSHSKFAIVTWSLVVHKVRLNLLWSISNVSFVVNLLLVVLQIYNIFLPFSFFIYMFLNFSRMLALCLTNIKLWCTLQTP